jgi:hypothetical protein
MDVCRKARKPEAKKARSQERRPAMSNTTARTKLTEERLEQTEESLDKVQAVVDDVRRVLVAAEKAQTAVERAREGLRTAQFVVIGAAIVLALIAVVSRRTR